MRAGRRDRQDGKNVPEEQALDYVLGYTCANDVSARDWQKEFGGSQWCRGKTFDTFCPLGPVLVTAGRDPQSQRAEDQDDPQRRGHAGLEHERHDLRRADADRIPQRQHDAACPAR